MIFISLIGYGRQMRWKVQKLSRLFLVFSYL